MIDEGLRTLLLAQAGITALVPAQTVGTVSVPGIFVASAVQGFDPPYVVITITGGDPYLTLDTNSETLKTVELDIDCFSYDKTAASSLDRTILVFLDDYTGAAGASDTIKAVVDFGEGVPGYENPQEGRDTKLHYVSRQYEIQYSTP